MILFYKKHIQAFTLLSLIGLLFMSPKLNAQQDTIYYDIKWKETSNLHLTLVRLTELGCKESKEKRCSKKDSNKKESPQM